MCDYPYLLRADALDDDLQLEEIIPAQPEPEQEDQCQSTSDR